MSSHPNPEEAGNAHRETVQKTDKPDEEKKKRVSHRLRFGAPFLRSGDRIT